MLKIFQARLQQDANREIPDVKTGFRKGQGTRDKLPIYVGSLKKRENSRKISTSVLLIMPKSLAVWITTECGKFFKRIPDHLTCLLRNLYASQEATVRTGHGTTDWFQMGKGVHQGYILSPCFITYMQSTS